MYHNLLYPIRLSKTLDPKKIVFRLKLCFNYSSSVYSKYIYILNYQGYGKRPCKKCMMVKQMIETILPAMNSNP